MFDVHIVDPLDCSPVFFGHIQIVGYLDHFNHEDALFIFLDVALRTGFQIKIISVQFTRFQRAGECSRQSTGSGRHHVIEGRIPFLNLLRVRPVMFGDRTVHSEKNGLIPYGHFRETVGASFTNDLDFRKVIRLLAIHRMI